jgi:predicted DNA-binding protein (UPF0251 family)
MRGIVDWIGAQADEPDPKVEARPQFAPEEKPSLNESLSECVPWQELRVHNFPAQLSPPTEAQLQDDPLDRNPDLWMYRGRTLALLRRYMRFSLETGRLPSFIGRECFRAKVSCYTATTFEDRVIFVRDVEKSLERLEYWDQQLIARIVLQEYEQEQAARIMHCSRSTVQRRLLQVLDLLSEDFLRVGVLTEGPSKRRFSE